MKQKWLIVIVVLALLISGYFIFVSAAQPTQQYNKIYLSPFYSAASVQNVNYTYSVAVNPPDGISSVKSAILTFDAYINPTRTFYAWVNNKTCNNPTYVVSTTYSSAGKAQFYFDCSNVINQSGNYNVTFRIAGGNIGASTAWLDLTYMNNPAGYVDMFGTEYEVGDNAKVWIQLLTNNQTPITDAVCYIDIYTPSNTEYIERALMTNMEHDGIYYYDLQAPSEIGVYPAIALCYYTAGQSYHNVTSYNLNFGTYDNGLISDMNVQDGTKIRFKETNVNPVRNISVEFNFSSENICNISEDLLTGLSVITYTKFDSVVNDNIIMSIYNYTSNTWIELPNAILEGNIYRSVSNSIITNNLTTAGLVNGSGTNVRVRFNDTNIIDDRTSDLGIDYLQLSCDQLTTPLAQEVRGASELHISNHTFEIADDVWNYTNRSLTEFNFDVVNESQIAEYVWGYNGTRGLNYFDYLQQAQYVWNNSNRNLTYIDYQTIANYVWQNPYRNLTYFDYLQQSENVWNFNNRNLTYFDFIQAGYFVWNSTERNLTSFNFDVVNESEIAQYVWSYSNRSLTELEFPIAMSVWTYPNRSLSEFNFDVVNETQVAESVWSWAGSVSNNLLGQIGAYIWNWTGTIGDNIGDFFANKIWTRTDRNLTYYNMTDTTNYTQIQNLIEMYGNNDNTNYTYIQYLISQYGNNDMTNYSQIQDLITQFGNNDMTNYTYLQYLISQYGNNDVTNYTLIQDLINLYGNNDVTNYSQIANLITIYGNDDTANYTLIQYLISQYGNNDATNYTLMTDLITQYGNYDAVNYTLVQDLITQYGNNQNQTDLTNYSYIQQLINQYGNYDMTNYSLMQDLMMQYANNDSTNYTQIQNLITQYGNTDNANYTLIQYLVQQYGNDDNTNYTLMTDLITQYGNYDVVNYTLVQDIVTNYGNFDAVNYTKVGDFVWNSTIRELTNFNFTVNSIINVSEVSENVWNYSNRSLSEFNFLVNASINNTELVNQIWSATNRSLSEFNFTVAVNVSEIAETIWAYSNRSINNFNFTVDVNTTQIADEIWNYSNRTVNATINTSDLINGIWNFNSRNLTFYPDMTNYSKINQGVWSYSNRTLFFLYGNGTGTPSTGTGKLPLTNIIISTPDPFYFDTPYTIYYDPVDIKGATVDIQNISVKILENITYQANTPTIMTDGRYEQIITIPEQEITSFTLSVNMTQNYIVSNQKSYVEITEKRAGITGFVVSMDDKTKRNLLYLGIFFLFILFIYVLIAVISKNKKGKSSNGYNRY